MNDAARGGRYPAWCAALPVGALLLGMTGIRWGLPGRERAERVLPPGSFGPSLHAELESSWKRLHGRLGADLMLNPAAFSKLEGVLDVEPGWRNPPDSMLDPIRSFHVRTVHDDEQTLFLVLSRMRPLKLELHPRFFTYGGAYVYGMGAWLGAGALLGAVPLHRSMEPYLAEPAKLARMYLWGRLASVACFVGCVVILLEAGRRHFGVGVGAFAAALFAFSPAILIQAHTMKPHMQWTFFALLTFLLGLRVLKDGTRRSYALAGAASGLAIGTVVSAWPACLYVAAAAAIRVMTFPRGWARELSGLALAGAASLAVFLAVNPYWLLDTPSVAGEFRTLQGWATMNMLNPVTLACGPLRRSVTAPILALMLAGLAWSLQRGRKEPALLLCALAFIAASSAACMFKTVDVTRQIRYFLPMIALGGLMGGALLSELMRSRKAWRGLIQAAALLAGGNLALEGALTAWNFRLAATQASTSHRAGDWIDANIPDGQTIGLFRLPAPSNTAYFRFHRYRLRLIDNAVFPALSRADLPRYLVITRPDYDERPFLEPVFSREYEWIAGFERPSAAWLHIDSQATTANPPIDVYRLKEVSG